MLPSALVRTPVVVQSDILYTQHPRALQMPWPDSDTASQMPMHMPDLTQAVPISQLGQTTIRR